MSLIQKLNWRYATKAFDKKRKLSEEQVKDLVEAFRLAPSSYGLQPSKLVLVTNEDLRQKLCEASWNQSQITDASHMFVLCRENKIDEEYINKYIQDIGKIRGMSDMTVLDDYKKIMTLNVVPRPDQESWMAKQTYIALGFMIALCAEMDVDSCPMEGFDPVAYDKMLGLTEKGLTACAVLTVGYRSVDDTTANYTKVRKSSDAIFVEVK
jgi:nitroreductase